MIFLPRASHRSWRLFLPLLPLSPSFPHSSRAPSTGAARMCLSSCRIVPSRSLAQQSRAVSSGEDLKPKSELKESRTRKRQPAITAEKDSNPKVAPTARARSKLGAATTACRKPVREPSVNNHAREVCFQCLTNLLVKQHGWSPPDAFSVLKNSHLVKDEIIKSLLLRANEAQSVDLTLRQRLQNVIHSNGVDVRRLFLGSIGAQYSKLDKALPWFQHSLVGESGVFARVSLLNGIGISRKHLWTLFSRKKNLLSCNIELFNHAVRGLRRLGVKGKRLCVVIRKHPSLLLRDVESETAASVGALQELGVTLKMIRACFLVDPVGFLQLSDFDIQHSTKQLAGWGLSRAEILNALRQNPSLLFRETHERLKQVAQDMEETGLEKSFVRCILVRRPRCVTPGMNEEIKAKFHFLENAGFDKGTWIKVISMFPRALILTIDGDLSPTLEFMRSLGFDKDQVVTVVKRFPKILGLSLKGNLESLLELLESAGLERVQLRTCIWRFPQILGFHPQTVQRSLGILEDVGFKGKELVSLLAAQPYVLDAFANGSFNSKASFFVRLGYSPNSTSLFKAIKYLSRIRVEALERKYKKLLELGFSHDEIREMVRKMPIILKKSDKMLEEKSHFLISTMSRPTSDAVNFTIFWTLGLESRMRPRYRVITYLKCTGFLWKEPSLRTMFMTPDKRFIEKYITRTPDSSTLFKIFEGDEKAEAADLSIKQCF